LKIETIRPDITYLSPEPETIHDFGGFASELYRLQYPAAGAPELALHAGRILAAQGFMVGEDKQRGLDHGAWVPLLHLYPDARLPVFQVSMPYDLNTIEAWRLGRAVSSTLTSLQGGFAEEHYLPLLVALGASATGDATPEVIEGDMTYGVLSMESYAWGVSPA
jgi:4,5-DOPA dioxygenase extradiol